MKLYLISQDEIGDYDTYDSAVVAAESEDAARLVCPGALPSHPWDSDVWASKPELVAVKYLGEADESVEAGVICASFNAG